MVRFDRKKVSPSVRATMKREILLQLILFWDSVNNQEVVNRWARELAKLRR